MPNKFLILSMVALLSSCSLTPFVNLESVDRGTLDIKNQETGSLLIDVTVSDDDNDFSTKAVAPISRQVEVAVQKIGVDELKRQVFDITKDTKSVTLSGLQIGVYRVITLNYLYNKVKIASNYTKASFSIKAGTINRISIPLKKVQLAQSEVEQIFKQDQIITPNIINISPRIDDNSFINATKRVRINGKQISDNPNNIIDLWITPNQKINVYGDVFSGDKMTLYVYKDSVGGTILPIKVNLSTDSTKQNGSFNYTNNQLLDEGKYFVEAISDAGQKFKGRVIVSTLIPENNMSTIKIERTSGGKTLDIPISGSGALPNKDVKIYWRKDGTGYNECVTTKADEKGNFKINVQANTDMQNDKTGNEIKFMFLDYYGRASNEVNYNFTKNTYSLKEFFPNLKITSTNSFYGSNILPSGFSLVKNYLQKIDDESFYIVSSGNLQDKSTFIFQFFDKNGLLIEGKSFVYQPNIDKGVSFKAISTLGKNNFYLSYYYNTPDGYISYIDKLDMQGNLVSCKKINLTNELSTMGHVSDGAIESLNELDNGNILLFYKKNKNIALKFLNSNFEPINNDIEFPISNISRTITETKFDIFNNNIEKFFTVLMKLSQGQELRGTTIVKINYDGSQRESTYLADTVEGTQDTNTKKISFLGRYDNSQNIFLWGGMDDISNTQVYGYNSNTSKKIKIDFIPTNDLAIFQNNFNKQYPDYYSFGNPQYVNNLYLRNSKAKLNYLINGIYLNKIDDYGNIVGQIYVPPLKPLYENMYKSFISSENDMFIITQYNRFLRFNLAMGTFSNISSITY